MPPENKPEVPLQQLPNPYTSPEVQEQAHSGDISAPKKTKKWLKYAIASINIIPVSLLILIMLELYSQQKEGTSGTEFIALAIIPIFLLIFFVVFLVDIVFLIRYLRKRSKEPGGNKYTKLLAQGALGLMILIIGLNLYSFHQASNENQQAIKNSFKQDGSDFGKRYSLASGKDLYKFAILVPNYLPAGYKYYYGQIPLADRPEEVYFEVSYHSDNYDFSMRTLHPQANFSPPQDCGYPLGPVNTLDPGTLKIFPCTEIGTIATGKIYYLATNDGDLGYTPPEDIYYTLVNQTLVILDVVKGPQAISQNDVLKIFSSLKTKSVSDIIQLNTQEALNSGSP